MKMPVYAEIRLASKVAEARRLWYILSEPAVAVAAICVANISERLLEHKAVYTQDIATALKSLVAPIEGYPHLGDLQLGGNALLRLDGRTCAKLVRVQEARIKLTRMCLVATGLKRAPVQGERGKQGLLKPIQVHYILQMVSEEQATAITSGNLAFVARGIPDSGSGVDAARRACQDYASMLTMPIFVLIVRVLHDIKETDGTRRACEETIALFLVIGQLRSDTFATLRTRAGIVKGKFTPLCHHGWRLELAQDLEDVMNRGTAGYCNSPQNILQISGVTNVPTDDIVSALASDHAATSILGLYRTADGASMIIIMDDRAHINLTELDAALGLQVRGTVRSSHTMADRVLILRKQYDQPSRLGRAKETLMGPLSAVPFTAVAASAAKTAKKVGMGLWLTPPIGSEDGHTTVPNTATVGEFPPLSASHTSASLAARKSGSDLRKGGT
jgi:hypothetical protein